MHYWSYAYNKIFKKIGATSFSFEPDPSGTLLGGSSAYMTPRDWARFGQLYLQVQLSPASFQYDATEKAFMSSLHMQRLYWQLSFQDALQLAAIWSAVPADQLKW